MYEVTIFTLRFLIQEGEINGSSTLTYENDKLLKSVHKHCTNVSFL